MAYLDPAEAFTHFRDHVLAGIEAQFPLRGRTQTLYLDKLEVEDKLHPDDLGGQHRAKLAGDTWAVPVYGQLTLKDNAGHVVDQRRIRLADIPKQTSRYSYVVGGREYQVDNQWQLKPGVYTRRRNNGELESRFNVSGRRAFDVLFDPDTKVFKLEYNKANLPLYPLLKALEVDDGALEAAWGKDVLEANQKARAGATALESFYKSDRKTAPPSRDEALAHFRATMAASSLRPDATAVTLGQPFTHVTGDALRLASEKMLRVHAGRPEDDRDNLIFKDLRTTGDYAADRLRLAARTIRAKVDRKINTATDVRDVLKFDFFNAPIREVFLSQVGRNATQINPVEMVSGALQTTVMGPGGIKSSRAVTDEAKFVNPSHLGFLDPIHTPEGDKTGVTLRLPIGVKKDGTEAKIPLYNLKTGKTELVGPAQFLGSNVALPDQMTWDKGVPTPRGKTVQVSAPGNVLREVPVGEVHYALRHPSQLFNMTSNLIPFLGNTSGNRASMASRHLEQAISLVHREAPLVQVATGAQAPGSRTFEELLGQQASHPSPVDGTVKAVRPGAVLVEDKQGKTHEVQLYNHYPLNDAKSVMHSTPLVKPGDAVRAGQTLADTNFAKQGVLALGTNLRVGYVPFKGYNFEDGIVISESAAKKLSSEHLSKYAVPKDQDLVLNKRKFHLEHPGAFTQAQYEQLDDQGVVKPGTRVLPGDPLVAAMKPFALKDRQGLNAIRRSMSGSHTNKSLRWEGEHPGEVVAVHHGREGVTVHVKTVEPMQVGDKMAGRYGNKGIVTMILPDEEMPHTRDGHAIEVALNPSGVPGRMNVGQVLETAVGKIAQKTGKPYVVKNFEPGVDVLARVKKELADHGLHDAEELIDPVTKQSLGKALVGPQHLLKLVHQVDKKISVRSGMDLPGAGASETYDINLQPTSGGGTGGQSMGTLGLYALLAHGAKANIREMQSYKSEGPDPQTHPGKAWASDHNAIWSAIQRGAPLPTPKPTFAFQKFTDYLRAAGINIEKKGHEFHLTPLTDDHIRALCKYELPKPAGLVTYKLDAHGDPKPQTGGLFDEKLTGGHGGRQWSRIALAEPVPNPVFEDAIRHLTGLSKPDFQALVSGEKGVSPTGQLTEAGRGIAGGAGVKVLLDRIEVKTALPAAEAALRQAKGASIDPALKKVKYLRALDRLGYTPSQAYVLHQLPVLPPVMRPISQLPDGNWRYTDLNQLYSNFGKINDKLKDPLLSRHLDDEAKRYLRADFYDGVKALMGIGTPYGDAEHKGILHQIAGANPKAGYFQDVLINRRQDMTMRSTIVPEPALGLDEVGIPRHAALDLYRPFVVRQLKQMGAIQNELQGPGLLAKKSPVVWQALDRVMAERPLLLKRDPALHKYSVQAFRPKAVHGSAIQIHPLVTGGFNADFDGDTMSAFVPITREAVDEAHRMFPSNNLFSEATGHAMYQPTLESALGLYKLSAVGKDTGKAFSSTEAIVAKARAGALGVTDVVSLGGKKTTPGRVLLAAALPEPMRAGVLHDLDRPLDKGGLDKLLHTLAKDHAPAYGQAVNQLKDLGNGASFGVVSVPKPASAGHGLVEKALGGTTVAVHDSKAQAVVAMGTHSLSLDDFTTDKAVREQVLGPARVRADAIRADRRIPEADKDRQIIDVYAKADADMRAAHEAKLDKRPTNLFTMYRAGVKPGWDQYKQMVLAPMLVKDSSNRTIPTPVTRSYAEGLDVGGYWTQMHGARRGSVMKVQEVREPGAMSKLLMNNMMHVLVNDHDCGTTKGIALDISEKDVHDRYLQQPFTHGPTHVPAGTILSPDVVAQIRAAKKDARVVVRSPLKCEDEKGICQTCAGLSASGDHHPLGTNVGVQSAHALGERAIQLTLKSFHTGGVHEQGGSKLLNSFARLDQLLELPKKIPNEATLAMTSGTIERVEPTSTGVDVVIAGKRHHVGKDPGGLPLHHDLPGAAQAHGYIPWKPPQAGVHVEAGEHLSDPNRTFANPHALYQATGSMEKVQNHLASEVYNLYKREGIKRRAVETVVRGMSNLTEIADAGDHPTFLRGEYRPLSTVYKVNQQLSQEGKRTIDHKPVLKGISVMPLELQEDWMAKLQHQHLRGTILEAASMGLVSNIHGTHPIPGLAFGSEFGLTSKDSKTPGREHLHDVAGHHY